ncbi:MAG: hypothetical protein EBT62_05575 [Opitutaceae bacterium]|nr:hypothetical protein [Opitutaceae bacterium]
MELFSEIYQRKSFADKFHNYLIYNTLKIIESYRFARFSERGVINLYTRNRVLKLSAGRHPLA